MAKGTPKGTKTAKPASATKGTPKSAAASTAAAASTDSASKKRVRLADDGEDAAAAATATAAADDTPAKKAKKVKVGSNGVERKDLKDKRPSEVEQIKSRDAPKPAKGALKKTKADQGDAAASADTKATKGKGKGKKVEQPAVGADEVKLAEDEADEDEDEDEDDEEEIDFLKGFESGDDDDGEDSSDEEMGDDDEEEDAAASSKPKFDTRQLPKVKGETVQKKLAAKEKKQAKTGTIYLGRIPKGFYEDEMRSYFSQFGEVTRLRLSRNKQTGASKHYAFIEFKYASVAQIVQETMDNYLLLGHILVCKVVPDDQVHPKLWVGANRKFRVVPKSRKDAARRNK
ncbi:hypothetical protein JCM3774_000182, partial [Rhodotorula dairenensis]